MNQKIKLENNEREILRSTLYQIAIELKTKNPDATANEIREILKDMIDVSV